MGIASNSLTERRIRIRQLGLGREQHSKRDRTTIKRIQSRDPEFLAWVERFVLRKAGRCAEIRDDPKDAFGLRLRR